MREPVKCSRCGKEYDLKNKGVKEIISCDHCHLTMRLNEKSRKRFRLVRYLFVLAVSLVLAGGMVLITRDQLIIMIVLLAAALFLANFADNWCLKLTDLIFGVAYEAYAIPKLSKKEKRKQNQEKEKKGWFKRR